MYRDIIDLLSSKAMEYGENFFLAIIFIIFGLHVSKEVSQLLGKAMLKAHFEPTLVSFTKSIVNAGIKVVFFINAVIKLGFTTSSIVAVIGTIGAAIALGFKDNLASVVSGMIILFTKPFLVGDYIEVQGVSGQVKAIQIIHTEIITLEHKFISVPNNVITTSTITNYSRIPSLRMDINFGVDYNTNIDLAKNLIMKCINNYPLVLRDPAPIVVVSDYGDSAIIITAKVWCNNADYWTFKFDLLELVKKEFDANGISIPFNQIDVHMKGE